MDYRETNNRVEDEQEETFGERAEELHRIRVNYILREIKDSSRHCSFELKDREYALVYNFKPRKRYFELTKLNININSEENRSSDAFDKLGRISMQEFEKSIENDSDLAYRTYIALTRKA